MRKNSSNTGHSGSKAGPFPEAWHSMGSGAPQSCLLGGHKRTSHLQVNRFPPTSKISVSEGCRSHGAAGNSPSQKVLGSQAESLQLSSPAKSKEKKQPAKPEQCLLVEGTTEEGRVQDQQLHAAPPSVGTKCTYGEATVSYDMGHWLGTHRRGGKAEFLSLS